MAKKQASDSEAQAAVPIIPLLPIEQAEEIAAQLVGGQAAEVIVRDAEAQAAVPARCRGIRVKYPAVELMRRRVDYILSKHGRRGETELAALAELERISNQETP